MKHFIAAMLLPTLLLFASLPIDAAGAFSVLSTGHWAYRDLDRLAAAGLVPGFPFDTGDGGGKMGTAGQLLTRYEMALALSKALRAFKENGLYRSLERKGVEQALERLKREFGAELETLSLGVGLHAESSAADAQTVGLGLQIPASRAGLDSSRLQASVLADRDADALQADAVQADATAGAALDPVNQRHDSPRSLKLRAGLEAIRQSDATLARELAKSIGIELDANLQRDGMETLPAHRDGVGVLPDTRRGLQTSAGPLADQWNDALEWHAWNALSSFLLIPLVDLGDGGRSRAVRAGNGGLGYQSDSGGQRWLLDSLLVANLSFSPDLAGQPQGGGVANGSFGRLMFADAVNPRASTNVDASVGTSVRSSGGDHVDGIGNSGSGNSTGSNPGGGWLGWLQRLSLRHKVVRPDPKSDHLLQDMLGGGDSASGAVPAAPGVTALVDFVDIAALSDVPSAQERQRSASLGLGGRFNVGSGATLRGGVSLSRTLGEKASPTVATAKAGVDLRLSSTTTLSAGYEVERSRQGRETAAAVGLGYRLNDQATLAAGYQLVNFEEASGTGAGRRDGMARAELTVRF